MKSANGHSLKVSQDHYLFKARDEDALNVNRVFAVLDGRASNSAEVVEDSATLRKETLIHRFNSGSIPVTPMGLEHPDINSTGTRFSWSAIEKETVCKFIDDNKLRYPDAQNVYSVSFSTILCHLNYKIKELRN